MARAFLKDYNEAVKLFRLAASRETRRLSSASRSLRRGTGCSPESGEALKLVRLRPTGDLAPAQYNSGGMYHEGQAFRGLQRALSGTVSAPTGHGTRKIFRALQRSLECSSRRRPGPGRAQNSLGVIYARVGVPEISRRAANGGT